MAKLSVQGDHFSITITPSDRKVLDNLQARIRSNADTGSSYAILDVEKIAQDAWDEKIKSIQADLAAPRPGYRKD